MRVDFSAISPREAYGWMTATILPRPIAWVSTVSAAGRTNLAPFSFFQGVTANPPTLMISVVNDRHGNLKDTVRNIGEVPEFVVNVVPYDVREAMNATAASLPPEVSEFERCGVPAVPSERVRPPRVGSSPVSYECALHSIVKIGEGPIAGNVVFGRILVAHVQEAVLGDNGLPDPARLDLIGRLGGAGYARTTDRFNLVRPD
ncbi:MAG TPA: flavin reductase family protein [Opitutaceae bacterium]|jgi:flavin reductase (DIM6/NTAB) family NADH-FMN oxidoreductase RutF